MNTTGYTFYYNMMSECCLMLHSNSVVPFGCDGVLYFLSQINKNHFVLSHRNHRGEKIEKFTHIDDMAKYLYERRKMSRSTQEMNVEKRAYTEQEQNDMGLFSWNPSVDDEQMARMSKLRGMALNLCRNIIDNVSNCDLRKSAILDLRKAIMQANLAIAHENHIHEATRGG